MTLNTESADTVHCLNVFSYFNKKSKCVIIQLKLLQKHNTAAHCSNVCVKIAFYGCLKKDVSETIGSYQTWYFDSTLDTWTLEKMSPVEQTAVDLRILKMKSCREKT